MVDGRLPIGRTSAWVALVNIFAKEVTCLLGLDDNRRNEGNTVLDSYRKVLSVDEVNALYEIIGGIRTTNGKPASILILDEMT